jgi:DNA-binding IclR family transcriptional regulator
MTERPPPLYPIESVDRALRLLLLLEERQTLRGSEAAQAIGVAPSTAHRLLSMLVYHGFVDQDRGGAYRMGTALLQIGLAAVRQLDVRAEAGPFLDRLAEELDETVHLAQLEGQSVRFIYSREGTQALRVTSRLGRSLPAHATSVGKAMLARMPMADLEALYPDHVLPPAPPTASKRVVQNWDDLLKVLADVRRAGHARNSGESEDGVSSIGIAVDRRLSAMLTGLSVAVPTVRASPARLKELTAALQRTAADLEEHLAETRNRQAV